MSAKQLRVVRGRAEVNNRLSDDPMHSCKSCNVSNGSQSIRVESSEISMEPYESELPSLVTEEVSHVSQSKYGSQMVPKGADRIGFAGNHCAKVTLALEL